MEKHCGWADQREDLMTWNWFGRQSTLPNVCLIYVLKSFMFVLTSWADIFSITTEIFTTLALTSGILQCDAQLLWCMATASVCRRGTSLSGSKNKWRMIKRPRKFVIAVCLSTRGPSGTVQAIPCWSVWNNSMGWQLSYQHAWDNACLVPIHTFTHKACGVLFLWLHHQELAMLALKDPSVCRL